MTTSLLASSAAFIVATLSVALNQVAAQAAAQGVIQDWSEWQWATFPVIGAVLAAITSVMFRNDRVRDSVGAFIFCLVVGVSGPKIVTLLHPALKHYGTDSILLILFGYLWAAVGFAIAKSLFAWLGRRGPQVAESELEDLVSRREKQRHRVIPDDGRKEGL